MAVTDDRTILPLSLQTSLWREKPLYGWEREDLKSTAYPSHIDHTRPSCPESEHMVLHDQVHQRVTMESLNRNVSQSLFCPVEMASKTVMRTQAYGHYRALVVWVATCRNLLVFFFLPLEGELMRFGLVFRREEPEARRGWRIFRV